MSPKTVWTVVVAAMFLALVGASAANAEVIFRCPGFVPPIPWTPLTNPDINGDGMLRGTEIGPGVPANRVCMHLAAGDGFIEMPDRRDDEFYMFGFVNVTGVPNDQVMTVWDSALNPTGAILGVMNPAPTIAVKEGDELFLTLTNVGMAQRPDLFDPHTVHWHGFPNASAVFDGLPDSGISINMGASLTYYYKVVEPGTFMYHCHVEATEHMQMGMLGNLYVTPAQDGTSIGGFSLFAYNDGDGTTGYDQAYVIQLGSFDAAFHDASRDVQPLPFASMRDTNPFINGRAYPDTVLPDDDPSLPRQPLGSRIVANPNDRILLRLSNLNVTRYYTVRALGLPMQVVGRGSRILRGGGLPAGDTLYYNTNSVTLGGGEAVDVIVDTAGVPPGTYFFYTTNLNYLSNNQEDYGGMLTEIVVN